jgi:hypothetical protein
MCERLKTLSRRTFYSKETHNLLNYLTLKIEDPSIQEKINFVRVASYNRLHKPAMLIVFLMFLTRLITYLVNKEGTGTGSIY